jgi:hypothetical protein
MLVLSNVRKSCKQDNVFQGSIETVVHRIYQTLYATCTIPEVSYFRSRYDGLLLLKTFLPQCSVEIFGENVIFWMQQCLKSVEGGQNKHALANVSYQVLSKKIFF